MEKFPENLDDLRIKVSDLVPIDVPIDSEDPDSPREPVVWRIGDTLYVHPTSYAKMQAGELKP